MSSLYRRAQDHAAAFTLAAFALGCVGTFFAVQAFLVNRDQGRDINRITRVQKTACNKNPASRKCAEQRQAVARAEPIKNPCISYQRVTGEQGRNCHRRFVNPERGGAAEPVDQPGFEDSPVPAAGGGHDDAPTSTGNQHVAEPGKGGSGGGSAPGVGGDSGGEEPANPGSTETTPPPPVAEPAEAKPVLEGAGKLLEDSGQTLNEGVGGTVETVQGVGHGVNCLLGGGC